MDKSYANEARFRWGATDAYREHEQKTKNYTKAKCDEANNGLMAIFAEFAACKDSGASAPSLSRMLLSLPKTASRFASASARLK